MTDFEAVYRSNFSMVYRYLCALTGDSQTAEELTSETFFKAMERLDQFRGECSLSTWLCRIGRNCYLTSLRRSKSVPPEEIPELPDPAPGPEELLEQTDTADRIHRILHHLEEPYKEVFSLRVFGELPFRKIGALFGKSENWACVTYHRARSKIQRELEELP